MTSADANPPFDIAEGAPTPEQSPEPTPEHAVESQGDQVVEQVADPAAVPGDGETPVETVPQTLAERLDITTWAARLWVELVEETAEPAMLEAGLEIARRRRGPSVMVSPGEISATVPDPPRSRKTLSILSPAVEHVHWERAAKRAAEMPMLSAQLIAGELPPEIETAASAGELRLLPNANEISAKRGRLALDWDENVCAAAVAFGKRLELEPGLLLTFRGMTTESFRELVRQCAALSSSGGRGAAAYAQRPAIGPDQEPPPLELCLDSFWAAGPDLDDVQTPVRAPQHPHSLLRRLGASPFEGAGFPLIGLLATCYDLMSEAEVRRAREGERVEDEGDSAE